jgi:hypothetical protein
MAQSCDLQSAPKRCRAAGRELRTPAHHEALNGRSAAARLQAYKIPRLSFAGRWGELRTSSLVSPKRILTPEKAACSVLHSYTSVH